MQELENDKDKDVDEEEREFNDSDWEPPCVITSMRGHFYWRVLSEAVCSFVKSECMW